MSHQQEGIRHFNKNNEPQNAAPIDHTGGVPGVDYKQRAKDALTGHHGSSTHDSSRTSGGIGSDSTGLGSSSTRSGAEYGSGTGTGISATGGPSGLASGTGATGTGLGSNSTTSGGLGGLGSGTGSSGRHGVPESDRLGSDNLASNHPTGHGGVGSTLTPGGERGATSSSTGTGATHGIPERAEHALESRGASNTGDHSVGTTGTHTGSSGRGGIQQELSQSVGKGGAVGGTGAGGMLGPGAVAGGAQHTGDVPGGRTSLDNTTTGGRSSLDQQHSGAHNTSGTGTPPKKEGLLAKIKHVVSKE